MAESAWHCVRPIRDVNCAQERPRGCSEPTDIGSSGYVWNGAVRRLKLQPLSVSFLCAAFLALSISVA